MEVIGTVRIIRINNGQIAKARQVGIDLAKRFPDVLYINESGNFRIRMPDKEFYGTTTPIPPSSDNSDSYFVHVKTLLSPSF